MRVCSDSMHAFSEQHVCLDACRKDGKGSKQLHVQAAGEYLPSTAGVFKNN